MSDTSTPTTITNDRSSNHSSSMSASTIPPLGHHLSSLLTQSPGFRGRIASITNLSPSLSSQPTTLFQIPSAKDMRNPAYHHLTCSVHSNVALFIKSLHTNTNKGGPSGRSSPVPGASGGENKSSNNTPLASPSHHPSASINQNNNNNNNTIAYRKLLQNLLTYIPALPSEYFAINKPEYDLESSSSHIQSLTFGLNNNNNNNNNNNSPLSSTPLSSSLSPSPTRIPYIGLSIIAGTGKIFYEEKVQWPIEHSNSTNTINNNTIHPPSTPTAPINPSPSNIVVSSSSLSSPSKEDSGLSRRRSISESDGEIILSLCILVESLEIDTKQVTFLASHRHLALEQLFKSLFKLDLTIPRPTTTIGNTDRPVLHSAALLVAPSPAIHQRRLSASNNNSAS